MRVIHEPVDTEPVFITQLIAMLNSALCAELEAKSEFLDVKTDISAMRDAILLQAYEDGTLDGEFREAKLLDSDMPYQELLARSLGVRETFKFAEIDRKVVECRVELMRAWLFSQCEHSPPDILGPVSPMLIAH